MIGGKSFVCTKSDGKVVKEGDDLMCATRYAIMSLRHASTATSYRNFQRKLVYPKRASHDGNSLLGLQLKPNTATAPGALTLNTACNGRHTARAEVHTARGLAAGILNQSFNARMWARACPTPIKYSKEITNVFLESSTVI